MSRANFTLTFPAFPGHTCRPVSDLSPEENQALMAEVSGIYRTIFAAVEAHTDANPGTRQLAYIMAAHAVKLALEGEEDTEPETETPALMTDAELAAVNGIVEPTAALIDAYIEASTDYPYDIVLEALHRLTTDYQGEEQYVMAELEAEIAAEEADA
jgi:hypothetical protein